MDAGPEIVHRLHTDERLLNSILRLPSDEQVTEIGKLADQMPASETTGSNSGTDAYIRERTRGGKPGMGRFVGGEK
jgi:hypothetical protein